MKRLLCGAGGLLAAVLLFVSPARAALQSNSLNNTVSPALVCSGPWIDVRCYGALGNDSHDDTSAITSAIADALANGLPVRFSPGTYKITSALTINTVGYAASGFRIIADNATIDATAVSAGPALLIERTGGTTGSPAVDTGLTISGALAVNCNVAAYCAQIGQTNFADEFKGARIDGLVVDNLSASASAGGLKVNYLVGSRLSVSGYTAGGAASVSGLAIEQLQDSLLGGAGSTAGASGAALLIENGLSTGNTIAGFNYASAGSGAVSNTCLSITTSSAYANQFVAPQGNCTTGINAPLAPSGPQNVMLGQHFTGTNLGPTSGGIAMVGRGSLNRFNAPAVSTYAAAGSDDGNILSPLNATGGTLPPNWPAGNKSLAVTLPSAASVGPGWAMGFVSAGSNALVLNGTIIGPGGQTLSSLIIGGVGDTGEFAKIYSDGTSLRLESASQATELYNGLESAYPTQFSYPSSTGYAATLGDNGHWISSALAGGTLTITLPSTTAIPVGWTIGGLADTNDLVFQVNGTSGGNIKTSSGQTASSLDIGNFVQSRAVLFFDGAHFREMTAASQGAISGNMIASGAIAAALGYTPLNPAGGTITGTLAMGSPTFPNIEWHGTNGWWQTAIDQAQAIPLSDFVLADKCTSLPLGGSCATVVDQIVDNNNQIGVLAYTVVNGGAAYNTGDSVTFSMGCQVNPTGIVTASGGIVSAVVPSSVGGYGRCLTAPSGTQGQLSTTGSGAGLTVIPTTAMNMPTLGIGGYVGAFGWTADARMYALTLYGYQAEPALGDLMLAVNGVNTGLPLDVFSVTSGASLANIDTSGDFTTRGYVEFALPATMPSFSGGQGVVYTSASNGLVADGDGSTYDVALRSSAGPLALANPHGTADLVAGGALTVPGTIFANGNLNATGAVAVSGSFTLSSATFPSINWAATRGSWQTAIDIGGNPTLSDFVLADKCMGNPGGPTCPSVQDQIYDNNNQSGVTAYAIVSAGAGYLTGDRVTFNSGCTVNPVGVVTASGGAVTAVAPYSLGGYGRCTVDPSGTQNQLSTTGAGSGLQVTMTTVANNPSLAIGQATASAAIRAGALWYELTVQPYDSEPNVGGLNLVTSEVTTGFPLAITTTSGFPIANVDNLGNFYTEGYLSVVTGAGFSDPPPSPTAGNGIVYSDPTNGLQLTGSGSANDFVMHDKSGGTVFAVPTGVATVNFFGNIEWGGANGLSCSGTPTSSFASTHGLVTHC